MYVVRAALKIEVRLLFGRLTFLISIICWLGRVGVVSGLALRVWFGVMDTVSTRVVMVS